MKQGIAIMYSWQQSLYFHEINTYLTMGTDTVNSKVNNDATILLVPKDEVAITNTKHQDCTFHSLI